MWKKVKKAQADAVRNITKQAQQMQRGLLAWFNTLHSAIHADVNFLPNDYNPPRYQYAKNSSLDSSAQNRRSNVMH